MRPNDCATAPRQTHNMFNAEGVLSHMTGLATGFAPMFRGEEPAGPDVGAETSALSLTGRFDNAMADLLDAVQSPGALDRTVQPAGGAKPGAVFARLVALDGLVHGWDLASSTNQSCEPPEELAVEVDAFARQAITDDMRGGGSFGPEQASPDGASTMIRLSAVTGRTATTSGSHQGPRRAQSRSPHRQTAAVG